jgi:hypothetical protein
MTTKEWRRGPVSWDEACRRASGRRHYNAVRQSKAEARRRTLVRMWRAMNDGPLRVWSKQFDDPWMRVHGFQVAAAELLGVHPSTICRDVQVILERLREKARQELDEEVELARVCKHLEALWLSRQLANGPRPGA